MNRVGHNGASIFLGTEVENSPMKGEKTLFVVGLQSTTAIQTILDDPYLKITTVPHIYFGANHSFDGENLEEWNRLIDYFLGKGYWCTLDFDARFSTVVHDMCLTENRRFIPMISVKLPYISLFNYNTTLKIDDIDFDKTNPGVWCHPLNELLNKETFTNWDQYSKDEIIK